MSVDVINYLRNVANCMGIDPNLAEAIATIETNGNPLATRYESNWQYFYQPAAMALRLGITEITEKVHQATSWGPMQIMGAVAREMGFNGHLPALAFMENGVQYACKKLKKLCDVYESEQAVIAAYNAGSPRKLNGQYVNQTYVNNVVKRLKELRQKEEK